MDALLDALTALAAEPEVLAESSNPPLIEVSECCKAPTKWMDTGTGSGAVVLCCRKCRERCASMMIQPQTSTESVNQ